MSKTVFNYTIYKYLGVHLDLCLGFKTHIKKVCKKVKFNLVHFWFIRNSLSNEAAKVYFHSIIISHITYCLTSWSNTHAIVLKPMELLYKQALQILDKNNLVFTIVIF